MELPSYSRQLLQQLYTLCKEQQFCDCTIFIGNVHFRAHKVVLAAASLLFKSLLDSTDTISIDSAMVSPEEFAVLLEMMYSGNLPPGKHNFTKVISMADNLQMFDVAVSCKNLLRDLISCSAQDQVVREASRQATDSSGNHTEANNLPQLEKNDETKPDIPIPWGVSPFPGLAETKVEADVSPPGQQLDVNHTWVQQDMMLGDSRSLQEDSGSSREHPAPAEQGGCAEQGLAEPLEEKGGVRDLAEESKSCELDFLLCYESVFSEALSDAQDVLKRLEECREMNASQKEALAACLGTTGEESVFRKLLKEGMDAQSLDATTLVSFLKLFGDTNPKVRAALLAREQVRGETLQQTESPDEGGPLPARLLGCREQLIQTVTHLSPITEFLEAAEEGFLTASEKRIISDCCEGGSQREAVDKLLRKVDEEKTLRAESLVKLLGAVKGSFPGLHLLLNNLVTTANVSDDKAKWSPEDYGAELLRQHQERLVELLTDTQLLLQGISAAQSLAPAEKEVMEQVVKAGGFSALVAAVLEEERSLSVSAVWQLLLAMREPAPLNLLMEEIQKQPGAEFFFQSVVSREITAIGIILRHSKLILEAIQQRVDLEALVPGEAGLIEAVKELLSISAQKESSEASLKAALSTAQEKSVPAIKICQLLCNVHEFFPDLQPVMQELGHMGFLTERSEEKPGIKKWKVNSESQVEALDKDEDKVGGASTKKLKKPQGKDPSRRSFVCKACEKTFRFSCRLRVHLKHCRAAWGGQSWCQLCGKICPTKEELEKHQLEVHGVVATAKKKKKKRRPVVCNICGRQFAHTSGMQYHKLTEHYDKKPFSCKECGAKFAANSTLKNHLRLHTGDRPFVCKRCPMTFMQASALAYHTKKKHAEGKMYSCQQCHAVFAQSVELSRHNRTHTGDKPYVCQECGKGFTKAIGLSGHLRTFHDFKDPYNCRKCGVRFPTLEEHRQHVHTVHPRACHPCPSCPKVFSAPSLLERHMVTHDGGKPFSCDICDKSYQQLSGLWYHNRTHHPDVFAAQNHRSSTFSPLQCSSCHKTFCSTAAHQKHVRAEHKGALQNCVTRKHFEQSENTFTCELCRELFPTQGELEGHYSAEHPKVVFSQPTTAQIVQVTQTSEQDSAEDLISFDDARLAGSQVLVTLPESQGSQTSTELVAVTMEDLFDDKVTLVREEIKCE